MIKLFLFRLRELNLNLDDLLTFKAFPKHAY